MRHAFVSLLLFVAACKHGSSTPSAEPTGPADSEPQTAALPAGDPTITCGDDPTPMWSVDIAGCEVPTGHVDFSHSKGEPQLRADLIPEFESDLETVGYEPIGCAADVRFRGDTGTIAITVAATTEKDEETSNDNRVLTGTGTWTPAGGSPCDLTVSGHVSLFYFGD